MNSSVVCWLGDRASRVRARRRVRRPAPVGGGSVMNALLPVLLAMLASRGVSAGQPGESKAGGGLGDILGQVLGGGRSGGGGGGSLGDIIGSVLGRRAGTGGGAGGLGGSSSRCSTLASVSRLARGSERARTCRSRPTQSDRSSARAASRRLLGELASHRSRRRKACRSCFRRWWIESRRGGRCRPSTSWSRASKICNGAWAADDPCHRDALNSRRTTEAP
jgi:hypothetical protein